MRAHARHWPLIAALLCALLAWKPVFVSVAEGYNSDVFGSAIRVYAILRGINAALSVAKETEIGVDFVGSLTAQPAMVLDPIDETVARVADAVFLLAAASGVLEIAFAPVARLGALLAAVGFFLLYLPRLLAAVPASLSATGRSLAGFGLVLGLALPVGYGLGGQLGAYWTEERLTAAEAALNGSATEIETVLETARTVPRVEPPVPLGPTQHADEAQQGWLGSLMGPVLDTYDQASGAASEALSGIADRVGSAGQAVSDAVPDMDAVQARGGEIFESSLTIVAIYTFRLLVLPLILLWLVVVLARRALETPTRR